MYVFKSIIILSSNRVIAITIVYIWYISLSIPPCTEHTRVSNFVQCLHQRRSPCPCWPGTCSGFAVCLLVLLSRIATAVHRWTTCSGFAVCLLVLLSRNAMVVHRWSNRMWVRAKSLPRLWRPTGLYTVSRVSMNFSRIFSFFLSYLVCYHRSGPPGSGFPVLELAMPTRPESKRQ